MASKGHFFRNQRANANKQSTRPIASTHATNLTNYMRIFNAALFFLLTFIGSSACYAAGANDNMKDALHSLVIAQNLEKYWPIIVRNTAIDGAAEVERGALAALASKSGLTDAEREKYKLLVKGMSSEVAAEINQLDAKLNVSQIIEEMVTSIYPKYYDVSEIRKLTAFYSSKTFYKLVEAELKITAESKRPGADVPEIRKQTYASFTAEDSRRVAEFSLSEIGRKQQRIGSQVTAECMEFLKARSRPAFDEVTTRYGLILVNRLRNAE